MRKISIWAPLLLMACGSPEHPQVAECEATIQSGLLAPATYKRVEATRTDHPPSAEDVALIRTVIGARGVPDEDVGLHQVVVRYDAANAYGTPLRETEFCQWAVIKNGEPQWMSETTVEIKSRADYLGNPAEIAATRAILETEGMATAEAPPPPRPKPVSLCWQDYCPCDPPQGGADAGLCRQLKAGMVVDDEFMAAGAMARDARAQIEAFGDL